jgi:formate dehydrogenase major subunit
VAGLARSFGSGAMTNSIAEIEDADAFIVIGSNTTIAHPVLATFIKQAVVRKGAKLIVADPRRIPLVDHSTIWLRQRPGTDIALINGLMHVIIKEDLADTSFIAERCENFESMLKVVESYPPERVEQITGVAKDDLAKAARIYGRAEKAMILYTMGITQHTHGTDNVRSLANLAMLTGKIGRPSTGVNPLRGQNNVQGACDMGGLPDVLPGYQPVVDAAVRSKFEAFWKAPLDTQAGMTLTEVMTAAHDGAVKGVFIMGENPIISDADTHHVISSLKKLDFLVVQDIFLTETAALADVVLPAACFAEKDGTFTNTERRVQLVRKAVEPPGKALADWKILTALAIRMGLDWRYESPQAIFEEIAAVTPSYGGLSYERLEHKTLQWPCPNADHPGTPVLHVGKFSRGKGLFSAVEHQEPFESSDKDYPLTLTTGRVLYQYHTRTMTGRCAGVNDMAPTAEVEMNPADSSKIELTDGELARVISRRGEIKVRVKVTNRVQEGLVFIPFHYAEASANELTVAALDPVAKIPEYKVCAVRVEKLPQPGLNG